MTTQFSTIRHWYWVFPPEQLDQGKKRNLDWKGNKTLFTDNMILYRGSLNEFNKKVLELIDELHKAQGHRMNT